MARRFAQSFNTWYAAQEGAIDFWRQVTSGILGIQALIHLPAAVEHSLASVGLHPELDAAASDREKFATARDARILASCHKACSVGLGLTAATLFFSGWGRAARCLVGSGFGLGAVYLSKSSEQHRDLGERDLTPAEADTYLLKACACASASLAALTSRAAPALVPLAYAYGFVATQAQRTGTVGALQAARGGAVATLADPAHGEEFKAAVRKAKRSLVHISSDGGEGSGWLYDRDRGLIVSNHHVVFDDRRGTVLESVTVQAAADGAALEARVVGTDPAADVALLRVDPSRLPAGAEAAQLGSSAALGPGDLVFAVGHPMRLRDSVSAGIFVAAHRGFEVHYRHAEPVLRSEISLNPGNSGGLLADRFGRVVGLNCSVREIGCDPLHEGRYHALSTSVEEVRRVVEALAAGRAVERPFLGASLVRTASGVRVASLVGGSPAAAAGLALGDRVEAVDGRPVAQPEDVYAMVYAKAPGDSLALHVHPARGSRPEPALIVPRLAGVPFLSKAAHGVV